jgi:hypothetical protein
LPGLRKVILAHTASRPVGLFFVAIVFSVFVTLPSEVARAADEVGKSVRIKNQVSASIGARNLKPRDPVFASEQIRAGEASHGEILLSDRSKVLVGENSVISLDDFITGSRGFSSGTIKVAKGAFRFITGNSEKGSMKVETPKSTIGVRGTVFDVYVTDSGETRVLLFQGEVEVCSRTNCITTSNACDVVEVNDSGAQELPYLRSGNRDEENASYKLTTLQGRFQLGWRAPTFPCAVRAAVDPENRRRIRNERTRRSEDSGGEYNPSGISIDIDPPAKAGKGGKGDKGGKDDGGGDTGDPCASLPNPVLDSGVLLADLSGMKLAVDSGTGSPCS